jgi:hypothetical protein
LYSAGLNGSLHVEKWKSIHFFFNLLVQRSSPSGSKTSTKKKKKKKKQNQKNKQTKKPQNKQSNKTDRLNLMEEQVGKSLTHTDTGENFLNRTPMA